MQQEKTAEEIIALGDRLGSLITSPGYGDLVKIVNELAEEANDEFLQFEGWDAQVISALKYGALTAKKYRNSIFSRIQDAVLAGEMKKVELQTSINHFAVPMEADEVRTRVWREIDERNETRIPGTY